MASTTESLIKLQAQLDLAKSAGNINKDILKLQEDLNKLKLKASIDPRSIQSLAKELERITSRTLTVSNIETDKRKLEKEGLQAGNLISGSMEKAMQSAASQTDSFTKKQKDAAASMQNTLNKISSETARQNQAALKSAEKPVTLLNQMGKSLKEQFSQGIKDFEKWLSIGSAIGSLVSRTKDSVSELKEADTLLNRISQTSQGLSKSQLKELGSHSFDVAGRYGGTSADYLNNVQKASLAGYKDAAGIAELSIAAQSAWNIPAELADQYIAITNQAYQLDGSVSALTETLDGAGSIAGKNSISMAELAEGLSAVSTQAAASQIKVRETAAAVGTLIAATHNSGPEMGNAFKGILMNLQQVTGDAGDGGEIIDEQSLAGCETACENLGVSLSTVKDGILSLKDPMQLLKELSREYTKLDESDPRRSGLLDAIGGGSRGEALDALLKNYSLYEKMLQDYASGTGTLAAEAERSADTWEGSLNRLANTWTDTIGNIIDSDTVRLIIDALNSLASIINNVTESLGPLGTISLGAGLFAGFKNIGKYIPVYGFQISCYMF